MHCASQLKGGELFVVDTRVRASTRGYPLSRYASARGLSCVYV